MSGFFRGYYRYTAFLNRLLPTTKVDGRVVRVLPSVCKPLGNEQVLAEYVPAGKNVLEIGCGSGIITLFLADKSTHVTAVDVSADAVDNTRINLAANAIENVTVILGNAFDKVGGSFDVVASNPPWVDFELDDPLRMWASSSTLIPSLFRESGRFLVHNGLLVISCPEHAREKLVELGKANGFELLETHPREKHKTIGVRLMTVAYLQVGFHPLVYVFEKVGRPAM
jgi:release factor glutamine methyltransferase